MVRYRVNSSAFNYMKLTNWEPFSWLDRPLLPFEEQSEVEEFHNWILPGHLRLVDLPGFQ
jgi:hypothetical protein